MGSPFKTAEEYLNTTGTMHSFTGHPALASVFLIISVLLTAYFLYKSYAIRR